MAVKIRLSRAGAKKTPHYRVIIADSRSPRDGRLLERVGTYNPLLPRDHPDRVKLKLERIKYWLGNGARPSERVAKFLSDAEVLPAVKRENPQKAKPKAKAQARIEELAKAEAEKAEAEKAEAEKAEAEKENVDSEVSSPVEEKNASPNQESEQPTGGEAPQENAQEGSNEEVNKTEQDGDSKLEKDGEGTEPEANQ